jgi:site-specific DNA-methyltransferase (adenine-specific)
MFKLYNHSSENMKEVNNESVDLVITDPPWNMGVKFGSQIDSQTTNEYQKMMSLVFSEISRIIKNDGLFIIVSTEKTFFRGQSFSLTEEYIKIIEMKSFNLINRIPISFSDDGNQGWKIVPLSKWNKNNINDWAYSKEGSILIFSKKKGIRIKDVPKRKEYYYASTEGHPCPFGHEIINNILDISFKKGFIVLDPFAGTANLGVEVQKRNGNYIGYELIKEFYEIGLTKLNKLEKNK